MHMTCHLFEENLTPPKEYKWCVCVFFLLYLKIIKYVHGLLLLFYYRCIWIIIIFLIDMERAICIPIKIIKLRSRQRVVSKNFKETQNEAVRYSVLPTKINLFLQNCRDWAKSKNERINWTSPTLIFLINTFSANFRPALPVKAQHTIVRSPIIIIFLGFGYRITKSISPFAANGLKRKHFYWVNNSCYIACPPVCVFVCVCIPIRCTVLKQGVCHMRCCSTART